MSEAPGVKFAISKVEDGDMSFITGQLNLDEKFQDKVYKNRKKFLEKNNIDIKDLVVMYCPHEDVITVVEDLHKGYGVKEFATGLNSESIITDKKGIVLGFMIADCIPIMLYDPVNKVIALAQFGWRSAGELIAYKTASRMVDGFDSRPEDILVYIGPGIRKESYIYPSLEQKDSEIWKLYINKVKKGGFSVDLITFAKDQLLNRGILPENIEDSGIDNAKDHDYFSHYRSTQKGLLDDGRFMAIITMS